MPLLSARHRRVLAAVCDTFQPPGAPASDGTGEPLLARVESLLALTHPDDQARLRLLLAALGTPLVNLALDGRWGAFDTLTPGAREDVLHGWAGSRLEQRRAGFQALKRLTNVAYYTQPVRDGLHPAWQHAGYFPPAAAAAPRGRLPVTTVRDGEVIDCDVVIAGSGAGGGVAAGVLAAAGRSVVVLEKGENLGPGDFTRNEADMMRRAFLDHGLCMTHSGSLPILAGSCVGGGTTINWTTSFPLPEPARAEWDEASGLSFFATPRFAASLDRALAGAAVNRDNSMPGVRDQLLEAGLRSLGWHVGVIPRNATGCSGQECGWCGFGCRIDAKRSTEATWLTQAVNAGARLIDRCTADRVLFERGRACGIAATLDRPDGTRAQFTVRARVVIAAAGSLHSPALLARSGVESPLLGRRLFLHPVSAVLGRFNERVEPWTGMLQTRYSDQFADQHEGYGARFETGPVHWALPASAFGWEDPQRHRDDVHALAHTSVVGILLRDRHPGRLRVTRAGRPIPYYELSDYDAAHLRTAMHGAAQVLAAAGARSVMTLQQPPTRAVTAAPGWLDGFTRGIDATGLTRCRMALISFHQMGTCPMGADPGRGLTGEDGQVFGRPGLYVADASCFPRPSGVNPMITIMAIADHVARGIAQGL